MEGIEDIDISTLQRMLSEKLSEMVDNGEKGKAIAIAKQFEKKVDIDVLKANGSNKDKAMMFKEAGWKYQQIADHLGVSVRTVNRWLN